VKFKEKNELVNSHAKHTCLKMWDKMKTSLKGKFKLATNGKQKMVP
jgi:hypothetical protein